MCFSIWDKIACRSYIEGQNVTHDEATATQNQIFHSEQEHHIDEHPVATYSSEDEQHPTSTTLRPEQEQITHWSVFWSNPLLYLACCVFTIHVLKIHYSPPNFFYSVSQSGCSVRADSHLEVTLEWQQETYVLNTNLDPHFFVFLCNTSRSTDARQEAVPVLDELSDAGGTDCPESSATSKRLATILVFLLTLLF